MHPRLLVFIAALLFSTGGVFVKVLVGRYGMNAGSIAAIRSLGVAALLIWSLPRLFNGQISKNSLWHMLGASISYTAMVSCFVYATSKTTAANAVWIQYLYPLFAVVGAALFFNEKVSGKVLVLLLVAMAGVIIIITGTLRSGQLAGILFALLSAVALTAFVLFQRRVREGSPLALVCLYNLIAGLILAIPAASNLKVNFSGVCLTVLMGIVQLGLPYILFVTALRNIKAGEAALITLAEPLTNPIWVFIVVGELPGTSTLAGSLLIFISLVLYFKHQGLPKAGREKME
jgi:drug/metabolite transporter (DMT)-like permease